MSVNLSFFKLFILAAILSLHSCKNAPAEVESTEVVAEKDIYELPTWARDAVIYEVNIRQFTEEGTFAAFEKHLPRISKMGVDIIWLMPIYEISKTKRKGSLGSPYAITDYKTLNPEFGSKTDFTNLVNKTHELGMKLILDFVPNHTGWDSPWVKNNPDWFTQDSLGNVIDPIDPGTGESWGWTDVADLNYDNREMRDAMINSFKFWVDEYDIDGFRQDVAHQIPVDFWAEANKALLETKPLFLLAEAEVPAIRNDKSFHADYGWSFHHLINEIAKGEKTAGDIKTWYKENRTKYNEGFHMHFTSNHDENTWAGTVFDRLGNAHKALAVLSFSFDGMPLIYGGQEEPLRKRLEFFEKDNIKFSKYEYQDFYSQLCLLKHNNPALHNGAYGSEPKIIHADDHILHFTRNNEDNNLNMIFNLSDKAQSYDLTLEKQMTDYFTKEVYSTGKIDLEPWSYLVLGAL